MFHADTYMVFARVPPDLVCHGFPSQPARYPLEPEHISLLQYSMTCMHMLVLISLWLFQYPVHRYRYMYLCEEKTEIQK